MIDPEQVSQGYRDHSPAPLTLRLVLARLGALALLAGGGAVIAGVHSVLPILTLPAAALALTPGLFRASRVFGGRAERYAIVMDRHGLSEVFRLRPAKRYRWEDIENVVRGEGTAVVQTALGEIVIGGHVQLGQVLALMVQFRLDERTRPPAAATVTPADVSAWLAVAPGESVTVKLQDIHLLQAGLHGCVVALTMPMLVGELMSGPLSQVVKSMFILALCGWACWFHAGLALRRVEATTERIRLRGWRGARDLSWDDLQSMARVETGTEPGWVVSFRSAKLILRDGVSGAARLAHAIEQAVAARQSGEVLPRMSDVSAAAISPVSAAVSAERGISAAGEEGGA